MAMVLAVFHSNFVIIPMSTIGNFNSCFYTAVCWKLVPSQSTYITLEDHAQMVHSSSTFSWRVGAARQRSVACSLLPNHQMTLMFARWSFKIQHQFQGDFSCLENFYSCPVKEESVLKAVPSTCLSVCLSVCLFRPITQKLPHLLVLPRDDLDPDPGSCYYSELGRK